MTGMKDFRGLSTRLLLACALSGVGTSAHAASQTGTITVVAIKPTNILKTADLDFGLIIPGAGGNVFINAQTGARTSSGGIILAGATFSRGRFVAAGTPNRVVTLSLNPSPAIVISNGTANMTINQLRVSANGGGPQPLGPNHTLNNIGVINFDIGGRLIVGANQANGLYTGTFTLTMDYQ